MTTRIPGCAFLPMAVLLLGAGGPSYPPDPVQQDASNSQRGSWQAAGKHGAVAAGGSEAVAAGIEILQAGGNAADAAVATILALTVTDATAFCFGGEVPIMVYDAKRRVVEVIAGQGAAPHLATREYFEKLGGIPANGIEPAAVPAALDACLVTLDRFGTRTFAEVAAPMLRLLDRGTRDWHPLLAETMRRLVAAEATAAHDRSAGLRRVADYFYRGPIAQELDAWSRENGGLIRWTDLAQHVTRVEDAVSADYHGHTIYKCGVWTQGPYVLQTMQMLDGFDLRAMGHNRPDAIHTTIEAMKLALADRDAYYADPLAERVPLSELLMPAYASSRRTLIDLKRASLELRPGDPIGGRPIRESAVKSGAGGPVKDTTTCLTADAQGMVVAATPSGWSGVLAGKTGVWLGTRLQSFNTWSGHPNCIEPGKRPRITLTPTIVLKGGKPVLAVSVAGGDGQDQATIQHLINAIDFDMAPAESVTAPRFGTNHHIGSFRQTPAELGSLLLYEELGDAVIGELRARGHVVRISRPPLWAPCVLAIDVQTGELRVAGDPRARRHAAAF